MRKQCKLLGVARSSVAYQAVVENPEDIRIKRLLDEIYMVDPCLGSRRLVTVLKRDHGVEINRKRLQRLRRCQQRGRLEVQLARSIAVVQLLLLPVVLRVPERQQKRARAFQ